MKKTKWSKEDKFLLLLQVFSFIVSVVVACVPENKMTSTVKLAIICASINIPIIIVQLSLTIGQNKNESDMQELVSKSDKRDRTIEGNTTKVIKEIDAINSKVSHIITLYEISSSKNERLKRFSDRRIADLINVLNKANQLGNSDFLGVREYYDELDYLANKLESDIPTRASIWAMTGFAPDEWSATGGYERDWTGRLQSLSQKGFKTVRLCCLSDDLVRQINKVDFTVPEKNSSLNGLICLLTQYYQEKSNCEHYVIRPYEFSKLDEINGFFGIILSSGEKHVIQGEAVNLNNGLTGKVLFDEHQINEVYKDFQRACQSEREICKYIKENSSEAFIKYLNTLGVKI